MVQLSTPWGDPKPGNGPPVRRFLSNYFDLLFILISMFFTWIKSVDPGTFFVADRLHGSVFVHFCTASLGKSYVR